MKIKDMHLEHFAVLGFVSALVSLFFHRATGAYEGFQLPLQVCITFGITSGSALIMLIVSRTFLKFPGSE